MNVPLVGLYGVGDRPGASRPRGQVRLAPFTTPARGEGALRATPDHLNLHRLVWNQELRKNQIYIVYILKWPLY